jgi:hypothetical protein
VAEPVIYREEVVGTIHRVRERSETSEMSWWRRTLAKKRMTKAELARWDENNRRLLELAQKAQADLDRREQQAAESGG